MDVQLLLVANPLSANVRHEKADYFTEHANRFQWEVLQFYEERLRNPLAGTIELLESRLVDYMEDHTEVDFVEALFFWIKEGLLLKWIRDPERIAFYKKFDEEVRVFEHQQKRERDAEFQELERPNKLFKCRVGACTPAQWLALPGICDACNNVSDA